MVDKGRLAGFVDAIIAVVMTIMLLEFHSPKSGLMSDFLKTNLVYLIAYLLSFIYVTTAWFNHQFMLHTVKIITRKMYIATVIWLLSLSLLPVLAAWTGQTMTLFQDFGTHSPKAPALLFMLMIFCWSFGFVNMGKVYMKDNPEETQQLIREMGVYRYLGGRFYRFLMVLSILMTYFYPPFVFIWTTGEMTYAAYRSHNHES